MLSPDDVVAEKVKDIQAAVSFQPVNIKHTYFIAIGSTDSSVGRVFDS